MKNMCKRLIMLLLVFAIVTATASATITAKAVDLAQECSLYVKPGGSEYADAVYEANVVLDVYQVAMAVESAFDSYSFSFMNPYGGIELSDAPDSDEWGRIAQEVARTALSSYEPPVATAPCETRIGGLSAGLYLVIARGEDISDYVKPFVDENGNENIATIALSGAETISFSPVLVSLPTKDKNADGIINSANPGDWDYDSTISLKPSIDNRFGALDIISWLDGYVTGSPATFVYDIEAVLNGESVYSDVVSVTFNDEGMQELEAIIECVPVGAEVTVTQVYPGVCYRLVTSATQTVVIEPSEVASVQFTNEATDSLIRGGGITYHIEYDEAWNLTRAPHNS